MDWTDFDVDTAIERDVLLRALPLVPTSNDRSSRVTIDMAVGTANFSIALGDTLGATPSSCVDLLQIRPLLTGAAWKVIDLLLETALDQAGLVPSDKRRWKISEKTAKARSNVAQPAQLDMRAWKALMATYVQTEQLRHSVVHRRVHTDANNALVGVDDKGASLRPLAAAEQEALARAAMRAAELVTAAAPDSRVQADLLRQLGDLASLHGIALPAVTLLNSLPEITVILDADPSVPGHYLFDVPALKARQLFGGITYADLVISPRDRAGQDLRGRLEDAPDAQVSIDPDRPPTWLA